MCGTGSFLSWGCHEQSAGVHWVPSLPPSREGPTQLRQVVGAGARLETIRPTLGCAQVVGTCTPSFLSSAF